MDVLLASCIALAITLLVGIAPEDGCHANSLRPGGLRIILVICGAAYLLVVMRIASSIALMILGIRA